MKVYYLSITSFSDVDMGILHHIKADAELTYGVVIQKRNANYTKEELQSYCSSHNIRFEPFMMKYNLKDPRCIFTFLNIIASIRKYNPDVIYIVSFDNIYLSKCALFLNSRKTIIALHDVEFHSDAAYLPVLKASRSITMFHFKNFQVFSREQLKTFKQLFPQKHVTLIPLPLKDFGASANAKRREPGPIRLLFFGNILYYKGLDILLEAMNRVEQMEGIPKLQLVVAGRCEVWDTVYEPISVNKNVVEKHIRFIGNDEVADFFSNADYLVLPYREATQSGPLKIAFHYNIPVIASDINSFKEEIEHGVDGYLFKAGSVADLADCLHHVLIRHETDDKRLKEAQLEYVMAHYSPAKVRHDFLEMFNKMSSV
jgi:glycosyltransferase involved in cell wall biosynthesis